MTLLIILVLSLYWINVVAFVAYALDKHYASYNMWRIPEALLITLAVLGGAYGSYSAMILFRHKTNHRLFTVTVPLFLIIWIGIIAYFLYFA